MRKRVVCDAVLAESKQSRAFETPGSAVGAGPKRVIYWRGPSTAVCRRQLTLFPGCPQAPTWNGNWAGLNYHSDHAVAIIHEDSAGAGTRDVPMGWKGNYLTVFQSRGRR